MDAEMTRARWELQDGLFRDPRLAAAGVPHGLTSRVLGDMKRPDRRAAAAAALGAAIPRILKQVHGAAVLEPAAVSEGPELPHADGWLTRTPGTTVGVLVSDCVPLFLWAVDGSAAGVFHAGWRGLAGGMVEAAVDSFGRAGVRPERLLAAAGPHIGSCCYEVREDLRGSFRPESFSERGGRLYLDLGADAASRLEAAGIPRGGIGISSDCTSCRADDFFSYRRDGTRLSLMGLIALPEASK